MNKIFSSKEALRSVLGGMLVQLCVGIIYLWSILKESVQSWYGMETSAANMVSSYMLLGFVIGCLAGGVIVDKFGSKKTNFIGLIIFAAGIASTGLLSPETSWLINITYAALGGFGSGVAYSSCISCIQKWMPENRGLASGLAVASFGLSTVVFVPVIRLLMSIFTSGDVVQINKVFFVLGGIFFVLGMIGCILVKNPPALAKSVDTDARNYTFSQALKLPKFWIIFFMAFFMNAPYTLATPVLYDLGVERGLAVAVAVLTVTLTGVANACGRFSMSTLSDKFGRKNILMGLFLVTLCAAAILIIANGALYLVAVLLMALCFGGMSSINATLAPDYFGPKNSGTIYGVIMISLGLSSIVFNFLTDNVFGGSAQTRFILGCISAVLALIMLFILNGMDNKDVKWQVEMSTTQMKSFLVTTKTLSYAKTAESLFLSPASVEKQVSDLENELNVKLFEEGVNNKLRLTEAGEMMRDRMFENVNKTNVAIRKAQIVSSENKEHLWIGVPKSEYATDNDVLALETFQKNNPDVNVMIHKGFAFDVLNMVENGKVDAAIVEKSALEAHPSLESLVTKKIRLGVVCSRANKLAEKETINLSECKNETFITIDPEKSPAVEARIKSMCEKAGFEPNTYASADAIELMILVEQNSGIAVLPENNHAYFDPMLKFIPLEDMPDVFVVCCWDKKNPNPKLKEFIDIYKNII